MRHCFASLLLAGCAAASGCSLHPPYGELNDNTSLLPPLSRLTHQHNLPPSQMLMEPGPGVGGPGPGVMMTEQPQQYPMQVSQIAFKSPDGMSVAWDVSRPGAFDSEPLITPGRYNFPQGAIYRLKLTNIPGRPGVELYPTLEVGPATPRTEAYLGHNAIPVQFTEEDLDQVLSGNFVTKVIYLPDPEFQELALAGVGELVSTRLDPGIDPIVEADRRGSILAIVRVGNKDLQIPGDSDQGAVAGGYGNGYGGYGGYGAGGPGGMGGGGCAANGYNAGIAGRIPPNFVAGMTAPEYGMTTCGTPIGLPGPPHIPLGVPAGLQQHVVVNHTASHIPAPVRKFRVDVKQEPGFNYPEPVHGMTINEHTYTPPAIYRQPFSDRHEHTEDIPDGDCDR